MERTLQFRSIREEPNRVVESNREIRETRDKKTRETTRKFRDKFRLEDKKSAVTENDDKEIM